MTTQTIRQTDLELLRLIVSHVDNPPATHRRGSPLWSPYQFELKWQVENHAIRWYPSVLVGYKLNPTERKRYLRARQRLIEAGFLVMRDQAGKDLNNFVIVTDAGREAVA